MVYFDKCKVLINGTGMLIESASVDSSNEVTPMYSIGKKGPINIVPEGPVQHRFNFDYYLLLGQDPSFDLVNTYKSLTGLYSGINVEICGTTGFQAYLTDYSLKVEPNQLTKVNASYISYVPMSGQFTERENGEVISNISGNLNIGWTAQIISGNSYLVSPIYGMDYNFSVQWQPSFILGSDIPLQVDLMGATEKIVVVRDKFQHILTTGELAWSSANTAVFQPTGAGDTIDHNINLLRYDFIGDSSAISPQLAISVSGARIQSSESSIQLDGFVKTVTTLIKAY